MAETKTMRLFAKEYQKKDGKGKFFGFFRVNFEGKFTHQIKLKQEAGSLAIKESGYYLIDVENDKVSIQKPKESNYKPIVWLSSYANLRRDVDYEAKVKALKQQEVDELLEDLPF